MHSQSPMKMPQADTDLFLSMGTVRKRQELVLKCYDSITAAVKYDFSYITLELDRSESSHYLFGLWFNCSLLMYWGFCIHLQGN